MCKHIWSKRQEETISVKEARKLLGAVSADYSDTDLVQVVRSMTTLLLATKMSLLMAQIRIW